MKDDKDNSEAVDVISQIQNIFWNCITIKHDGRLDMKGERKNKQG